MPRESKEFWKCTTETGRVYIIDDFGVVMQDTHGNYRFRGWKVTDRETKEDVDSQVPIVGKALFCYNFHDWRLTTNLVKIEDLQN